MNARDVGAVNQLQAPAPLGSRIDGVRFLRVPCIEDQRGSLAVVSRADWVDRPLVQWNLSASVVGAVRGLHVHLVHVDWLLSVSGTLRVGLFDLRTSSTTEGVSEIVELKPMVSMLAIPPGVGHVFVSVEPTVHLYGTDEYWDPADEFGCRWDDPDLGFEWVTVERDFSPILSPRDSAAGPLCELRAVVGEHWPAR
jgi:dTDP-4-dehydrorhamnose 3,5-epimerase